MKPLTRMVEVRQKVLKQNEVVARAVRQRFQDAGVFVVSLVSSPGSGKTAFLERTLSRLGQKHLVAALVGDLAADAGAQLSSSDRQIHQLRLPVLPLDACKKIA